MKDLKQKIILSIISIVVIAAIVISFVIELSYFKDVPVYMQHIYGHDLELYKQHAGLAIGIIAGVLTVGCGVIIFVDKKDDEEK